MPGMIDAHVHLATSPNRRQAEAGLPPDIFGEVTLQEAASGHWNNLDQESFTRACQTIPPIYDSRLPGLGG